VYSKQWISAIFFAVPPIANFLLILLLAPASRPTILLAAMPLMQDPRESTLGRMTGGLPTGTKNEA
jgi:hypothetical protein